jgi:hypothetical protein
MNFVINSIIITNRNSVLNNHESNNKLQTYSYIMNNEEVSRLLAAAADSNTSFFMSEGTQKLNNILD